MKRTSTKRTAGMVMNLDVARRRAGSGPAAPSPGRNRAAEFLAGIGLVDPEIARLQSALAVIPLDEELVGRARAFVAGHVDGWSPTEWKGFLADLAAEGYAVGPERTEWHPARAFVGILVEAIRACECSRRAAEASERAA